MAVKPVTTQQKSPYDWISDDQWSTWAKQAQEVDKKNEALSNPTGGTTGTGGTTTIGGGNKAPVFDANTYYNNQASQYTDLANKQKELALGQFRQARDKAVGDVNTLKTDTSTAYQNNRNQTDFQSKQAANRLREMMASQGLMNSGTNVSGQMRLNAANINALNDLDLGERRAITDYDKQIAEWMDPSQESNINSQYDIELLKQLTELRGRADDRAYDNDWKTYDANYQVGRDSVADSNRLDDIARDEKWKNVDNGWKSRDWQHGLDREKIEDARYADETAYKRKMDAIQLARSRSGGGGGGRRSSGGSRGGSASGHYDEQQIGAEYINTVLGTRSNRANAQEQFNRDKASLAALGMSPKEIAYIQKQLDGYKDDWVGPGYNSKNAPKNPLAGFWGTFNPNYKYVK